MRDRNTGVTGRGMPVFVPCEMSLKGRFRTLDQVRNFMADEDPRRGTKRPFPRRYPKPNIDLLAEVGETSVSKASISNRRGPSRPSCSP